VREVGGVSTVFVVPIRRGVLGAHQVTSRDGEMEHENPGDDADESLHGAEYKVTRDSEGVDVNELQYCAGEWAELHPGRH
jgi:hypothetical protein